jgi:fructokinase
LPACYCGRAGCIETYLSGPGLARDHQALTGGTAAPEAIVAGQGAALGRYEERLARALASVINVLDPDVIVLGGGMSNVQRLYTEVPRLWSRHVFSDHVATRLVRNAHGDSSGVRGAAWLWDS